MLAGGENAHVLFFDTVSNQPTAIHRHPLQLANDTATSCISHPCSRSLAFVAATADGRITFYSE